MNEWGEVAGRGLVVIGIAALATAVMTLVLIGVCVLLERWWPLGDGIDLDEADRPVPTTEEINAQVDRTNEKIRAYNRTRPLGTGYDIPEVSRWVDFNADTLPIRKSP